MTTRACRILAALTLFALLLAACQPIQPVQPVQPAAPADAEAEAAAEPAWVERTFPVPGVTVSLPEEWIFRYEPQYPVLMAWSADPPAEPQNSGGHWEYLMEEPIAEISFINEPYYEPLHSDLAEALTLRFQNNGLSGDAINPAGNTTVVEEPTLLTINGQPAAKMVVEGIDKVLQKPFRAYVYVIQNGDHAVYVSSALVEANEAAFVPLVDQIARSVVVSAPQQLPTQPPEVTGEIAPGETVHGTLRLSLPDKVVRDYWHFTAEAGKRYIATALIDDKYNDALIDVVDATGKTKLGVEQDFRGKGEPETAAFRAKEAGDYYIAVRNFFLDDGGYTLELQEAE
jgi:hypothetical protein